MRCLSLARTLRDQGANCRFVCRQHPGHLLGLIRQLGFEAIVLPLLSKGDTPEFSGNKSALAHSRWLGSDWQTDASQTIFAQRDFHPDWVIVDHYSLDHRWESHLKSVCRKLMVIDDLADRKHECDLLLDQNLVANQAHRYDGFVPSHCVLFLGPRYALLQPEYAGLHVCTGPRLGRVKRILVYFGGADTKNLTERAIIAFLAIERSDLVLDVVINSNSPHAAALQVQVKGRDNIVLHKGLPSLAPLMARADLAIGGAGATSWDRCCLGLPALVVTLAENQTPIAAELQKMGLVRWLGDEAEVSVSALRSALLEVLQNEDSLAQWSSRCRATVNGQGTVQVAELLLLNSTSPLTPRPACLDDETMLLSWANDPLVRQNAFSSQTIDESTHKAWFHERLRNPQNCQIYILETRMGIPIGQVRFERSEEGWEVDYSLIAAARGRGLGANLLQTAIQAFRQSNRGGKVFGRVKSGNLASEKVFGHLGFRGAKSVGGSVYQAVL